MAHGDAVAHANGGDQDGGAACHLNAGLDGIGDLVQIHMAWHDLAVGAHHADQRALQLFLGVTQCIEQASVRGALRTLGHIVASHFKSSFLTKTLSVTAAPCHLSRRGEVFAEDL
jgi:hypothetical protein